MATLMKSPEAVKSGIISTPEQWFIQRTEAKAQRVPDAGVRGALEDTLDVAQTIFEHVAYKQDSFPQPRR